MTGKPRFTAQEKKASLLSGMKEVRAEILSEAAALPGKKEEQVFLGVWSVKDLLAHLAGWDIANLEGVQALLQGRLPEFYSHIDRDWKTFNAQLVSRHNIKDYAQLIDRTAETHACLLASLEDIPAGEFQKDRQVRYRGYRVTIARILQSELDDERAHLEQIKYFVRQFSNK